MVIGIMAFMLVFPNEQKVSLYDCLEKNYMYMFALCLYGCPSVLSVRPLKYGSAKK